MGTHRVTRVAAIAAAALALLAGGMPPAKAQTITLDAIDSGLYDNNGRRNDVSQNYVVGQVFAFGAGPARQLNNYFVFDLSSITQPIASAELRLLNPSSPPAPGPGYNSPDPFEIYTLFDVSTPASTLLAGSNGRPDIFADLGSGVPYGSQVVSAASNGQIVTIGLNAAGVSALSSASGLFAVGGSLTTIRPGDITQTVFSGGGAPHQRQLVVTLIPEPGTLALLGTGTLTLLGCGWRRRTRAA